MANVTAKLRVLDMRGETTNTRWGSVTFDAAGLAEVEVPEEELEMLRSCRPFSWLASDHGPAQADAGGVESPAAEPLAPAVADDGKGKVQQSKRR